MAGTGAPWTCGGCPGPGRSWGCTGPVCWMGGSREWGWGCCIFCLFAFSSFCRCCCRFFFVWNSWEDSYLGKLPPPSTENQPSWRISRKMQADEEIHGVMITLPFGVAGQRVGPEVLRIQGILRRYSLQWSHTRPLGFPLKARGWQGAWMILEDGHRKQEDCA